MDLSIVKLFPDNLVKALCDTLIHSLWQGLLMAAITGLIIMFTRKSTPARRYNLLIATMVLFAAGTVCTFIIELSQAPVIPSHPAGYYQAAVVNMQAATQLNAPAVQKVTIKDTVLGYFNRNASVIVLIWFMIVCARCLQLATGLQGVYYLRHKNVFKADRLWENRVAELAENLGIKRMVTIAESGLAKVPMVIGHLKPLILIPVGLLTAMPAEEIEAILVHELAHIRRSDYLVNLLQSLMEIIFFFNPAVLWISALIKTERENCCDDIAIAQSSSKVNYIKALVSCQEYNVSSHAYAMALKGDKKHLKDRVTRIISNSNHSLNRMEKSLLAICLVTAGLCTAAFTNAAKINKLVDSTSKAVAHAGNVLKKEIAPKIEPAAPVKPAELSEITKPDTLAPKLKIYNPGEIGDHTSIQIPNGKFATRLHKEKGILYQFNYKHNVLISMQVNGKTVPSDEMADYQTVIDGMPHDNHTAAVSVDVNTTDHTNNAVAVVQHEDQQTLSRLDAAKKLNISQSALQRLDAQRQKKDLTISDSVYRAYKKYPVNPMPLKPYPVKEPKPIYDKPYGVDKPTPPYSNEAYKATTVPLKNDERRDKVIRDMISDGLIASKDNLSFKISTSEFIVNGKKQPDAVYQKYRAKYVKIVEHGEWSWLYNYDTDKKIETNSVTDSEPGRH